MKKALEYLPVLPFVMGAIALFILMFTDGNQFTAFIVSMIFYIAALAGFLLIKTILLMATRHPYFTGRYLWIQGGVLIGFCLLFYILWTSLDESQTLHFRIHLFDYILFSIPVVLFCLILWNAALFIKYRKNMVAQRWWPQSVIIIVCLAMFLSIPFTLWPFHIAYKISRVELQRVALDIQAGKSLPNSSKVGLFVIEQAKLDEDSKSVCLYTSLNPAGKEGFSFGQEGCYVNLQTEIKLDGDWRYLVED